MTKAILVFDSSPLNHFARAGELETLRALVSDFECVTTRAVLGELQKGASRLPIIGDAYDLAWLKVVSCDELDELYLFSQYMNRLGHSERNAGEASVLAWAEAHSAAAYVDDQVACNVGRGRGVRVHRTLQLVIAALKTGYFTEARHRNWSGVWLMPRHVSRRRRVRTCSDGRDHETLLSFNHLHE